jgi:cobalt-zinc-cadmium resistance protein CzcA
LGDPAAAATVAGVAGIDSIGGYEKQFVVEPDPAKLATYHISFSELAEALEKANISVGANFVERGGEAFLVKADGRIRTLDEIGRATVATRGGVAVAVRDVAMSVSAAICAPARLPKMAMRWSSAPP